MLNGLASTLDGNKDLDGVALSWLDKLVTRVRRAAKGEPRIYDLTQAFLTSRFSQHPSQEPIKLRNVAAKVPVSSSPLKEVDRTPLD